MLETGDMEEEKNKTHETRSFKSLPAFDETFVEVVGMI